MTTEAVNRRLSAFLSTQFRGRRFSRKCRGGEFKCRLRRRRRHHQCEDLSKVKIGSQHFGGQEEWLSSPQRPGPAFEDEDSEKEGRQRDVHLQGQQLGESESE